MGSNPETRHDGILTTTSGADKNRLALRERHTVADWPRLSSGYHGKDEC